ncbi:MAG: septum site-determining protein MinC [Lachnospiraceae bacterium]
MIIIKLDDHGMIVKMDADSSFNELMVELEHKLQQSGRFFRNARVALTIEGRKLSDKEEVELIKLIERIGQMEIVCILEHDEIRDAESLEAVNWVLENRKLREFVRQLQEENQRYAEIKQLQNKDDGKFYKGTLRSGQVLESDGSIIVLGDVNPGGKVTSKKNIIVLGALKGYACAGTEGDENAFVAALEMLPAQIRIGDVIARSADNRKEKQMGPKIAFMQEGTIYIESISKNVLNGLSFPKKTL